MEQFALDPRDESPHPPERTETFNESVYANGFDLKQKLGGWMRIGNRVNEGYAELSVCLYLPDGRIACQFGRPKISGNERFAAGGLSMDVIEPFKRFRMAYEGEVLLVDHPDQLRDPETGLKNAPRAPASVDWALEGVSPIHGGRPLRDDQQTMYGRDFSLNHFNQHLRVTGRMSIGGQSWQLDGHGWRDHSWGPRIWQVIYSYRLLLCNFGDGCGFMLLKITDKSGVSRRVGVLMVDHQYEDITDLDVTTTWAANGDPLASALAVRTARRTALIKTEILSLAPLRNRRKAGDQVLVSRIWEGATRFTWDGKEGMGISEYIERLDDGRLPGAPV
ncbi:MAG: hypothetical protein ISP90_11980 [Nevskia sp.]|nr:hypothetical protein [Nevskia sp.]